MQELGYNILEFSNPHVQECRSGFFNLFSCHWIWYITEMGKPLLHTSATFLNAAICTSKTTWHPMRVILRFTLDKIKLRTRETLKLLWSFTWGFSKCHSSLLSAQSWHSCYSSQNTIVPMQGVDTSTALWMDCSWRTVSMVTNVCEYKSTPGWTASW